MSKPDDIPADIWLAACFVFAEIVSEDGNGDDRETIARAIYAAREAQRECDAKACDRFDGPASDSEFCNGQATAAQQIRHSILTGAA